MTNLSGRGGGGGGASAQLMAGGLVDKGLQYPPGRGCSGLHHIPHKRQSDCLSAEQAQSPYCPAP